MKNQINLQFSPQFDAELQFKFNTAYRTALKGKGNWCEIVKDPERTPITQQLAKLMRAFDPDLLKPCPLDEFVIRNFTFHSEVMTQIFPSGDYKFLLKLFNKDMETMNNTTVVINFASSNQKSFVGRG